MTDPAAELARLVEEVSGNVVPPSHQPFLAHAAEARVRATGRHSLAAYVEALGRGTLPGEWGNLLPLVTVNESYLFRTPQHFTALTTTLLPRLLAARARTRRLRAWSAGCARGEEPATLAIVFADAPELAGWDWRVLATDVDEEALADARRGSYGGRAIASAPPEPCNRYLLGEGDTRTLAPALLSRIDYRVLNLVREPLQDPGGPFDLIFLRNVLIYFRPESQRRVAAAIAATLAADGYLFVGPAETLWQISEELEPVDLGDCFCYRRRSLLPPTPPPVARGPWPEKDRKKNRRAQAPTESCGSGGRSRLGSATELPGPPPEASAGHGPWATGHVLQGTREKLEAAARHLLADRLAEAVDLVDQVLAADPADAEAHVLEGFIHDLSGRTEMAIASLRAALYLDPALFQAHLLLADALRRLGWKERALTAYRAVLAALSTGNVRELTALATLPLPDRVTAAQRARVALSPR